MQIDPQVFLRLAETAKTIGFVDIEATGLRGDYNSVVCVSIGLFDGPVKTLNVDRPGDDKKLVIAIKDAMEKLDCWVTYYGKGFDIPMLNTRLLRWNQRPIEPRPHIDLYYTLKSNLLTARRSQAHLLRFLDTQEQKMDMNPDSWNALLADPKKEMKRMVARCESDVQGLEALYKRTRHLVRDIRR